MKYSYQREKILEYVLNSCEHPTAEMVYANIKKDIPNISLGTVYRNLNTLSEMGKIKKIPIPNHKDRFDKTIFNHCHIHCVKCHKAEDVSVDNNLKLYENIEKKTNYHLISYDIVFEGICNECFNLERNEKNELKRIKD